MSSGKRSRQSGKRGQAETPRSDISTPWFAVGSVLLLAMVASSWLFRGELPTVALVSQTAEAPRVAPSKREEAQWRFEVTRRLQKLLDEADKLERGSSLDSDAVEGLEHRLAEIEKDVELVSHQHTVREVLAIVSVVRGSLRKRVHNLTDAEVARAGDAFSYSDAAYWDFYYNGTDTNETYEWLVGWDGGGVLVSDPKRPTILIRDLLWSRLPREGQLLMLGCGNSDMSEKMYRDGFRKISNIDISHEVLVRAQARLPESMPEMKWLQMSAAAMDFSDEVFDVIIDKSTLDALEHDMVLLEKTVREAHRVLRRGGLLVSLSFRSAAQRVDRQLRNWARWGECELHVLERIGKVTRSVTYMHLCTRN